MYKDYINICTTSNFLQPFYYTQYIVNNTTILRFLQFRSFVELIKSHTLNCLRFDDGMTATCTTNERNATARINSVLLFCVRYDPRAIPTLRIAGTSYIVLRTTQSFRLWYIIYPICRWVYVTNRWILYSVRWIIYMFVAYVDKSPKLNKWFCKCSKTNL